MPRGHKHGLRYTAEYRAWINMRQRCNNPSNKDSFYYHNIVICEEWSDPICFINDMGAKPSVHHELDRIDNTKGYCKSNCRWVIKETQMRNTRISKWWYVNGVKYSSLSDASNHIGVTINTIKKWCEGTSHGKYKYPPKFNCWSEKKYG